MNTLRLDCNLFPADSLGVCACWSVFADLIENWFRHSTHTTLTLPVHESNGSATQISMLPVHVAHKYGMSSTFENMADMCTMPVNYEVIQSKAVAMLELGEEFHIFLFLEVLPRIAFSRNFWPYHSFGLPTVRSSRNVPEAHCFLQKWEQNYD